METPRPMARRTDVKLGPGNDTSQRQCQTPLGKEELHWFSTRALKPTRRLWSGWGPGHHKSTLIDESPSNSLKIGFRQHKVRQGKKKWTRIATRILHKSCCTLLSFTLFVWLLSSSVNICIIILKQKIAFPCVFLDNYWASVKSSKYQPLLIRIQPNLKLKHILA